MIFESILEMFSGISVSIFSSQEVVSFCKWVPSSSPEDSVEFIFDMPLVGKEDNTESYDSFDGGNTLLISAGMLTSILVGSLRMAEVVQFSEKACSVVKDAVVILFL